MSSTKVWGVEVDWSKIVMYVLCIAYAIMSDSWTSFSEQAFLSQMDLSN